MERTKVGINGFGRIGRQALKAINERHGERLQVVAINDLADAGANAHLFRYDSTYGRYPGTVEVIEDGLMIDSEPVRAFSERNPGDIPWRDLGVEIVIESTGLFVDAVGDANVGKPGARVHIDRGGAKKVVISAPAKNEDVTIVLGVNDDQYDPGIHHVLSNASCTTNCLAPPAKVINDNFGIEHGVMTTVHAYTNDQRILDVAHQDMRRARAAAQNIIPTTTGAARAVALVIPELQGRFDGHALRVPTASVSIVDFVAVVEREATVETVNAALRAAARDGPMHGILGYSDEPLVSSDYRGDPRSSTIDARSTLVMGGHLVKIVTWYDNEWGYACRTADLTAKVAQSV